MHPPRKRASRAIGLALMLAPTLAVSQPKLPSCDDKQGLDANTFAMLLNQRFSALVSPKTEGVPGTYLSVDLKEADAAVGTTFINASGNALTLSAHGGLSDGVLGIAQDSTLGAKFGASLQFHFLSRVRRGANTTTKGTLQYDAQSCTAMDAAIRAATAKYALREAEIRSGAIRVQRALDSAGYVNKRVAIDSALRAIEARGRTGALTRADTIARDSLRLESARAAAKLMAVRAAPEETSDMDDADSLAAQNERDKAYYEDAPKLIEVAGYAFGWWSLGVSVDNATFNLFDPAVAVASQISKRTHLTRAATLTYSHIRSSAAKSESRYWALGLNVGLEDNLADLKKVSVIDRKQYAAPPAERVIESSTTAYQGAYDGSIKTLRVTGDLYQFFVPHDRLAYHIFPAYSAKSGSIGEVSLGAGLLLSAQNLTDKKSVLNAELFFNAPDLGDVRDTHVTAFKRGVLGIRVTFPFAFTLGS